jgi:periplasmic divalent cation tolerance protein
MTDKLIVFVTCEGKEQAAALAAALVEGKLAACVNVLPGIQSCYTWEKKLTWSEEVLLLIKTTKSRFTQMQEKILEMHTYEVPEIVGVEIEDGLDKYLDWIQTSVT